MLKHEKTKYKTYTSVCTVIIPNHPQPFTHFPQRWHFQRTLGLFLWIKDKVIPGAADGRSGPAGGEKAKDAVPQPQKCLGPEVREASAVA